PSKSNPVLTIALSPANSATVLAGLFTGEVIRSTDSGHTWQAITDFGDRLGKLRFANANTVYGLTLHKGMRESHDGGLTWQAITDNLTLQNLSGTTNAAVSISAFYDFSLDAKQSGVIYIAAQEGVVRTVNDGKNWSFLK